MTSGATTPNGGTTHLRVAEEAGVGRATMYRHWPSVEDLLTDVLVDCHEPWEAGEPSGDLRTDLITEMGTFVAALQQSKLPEVLVTAMERAPTDPRIGAMHDSMTEISRSPMWTVVAAGIGRGELSPNLDESKAAAHTLGPLLYQCLFDKTTITPVDIERVADSFLTAFRAGIDRSQVPHDGDGLAADGITQAPEPPPDQKKRSLL